MYQALFTFAIGLAILLFTTQKLVKLAESVSAALRISPLIIGATIVAIGTSLPELVVSVIAVLNQDPGLAMGNIIGSNIINILMVFPVALFIGKLKIGKLKTQRNALLMLGVTILFVITQFVKIDHLVVGALLIGVAVLVTVLEYKLGVYGRDHEDYKLFQISRSEKFTAKTLMLVLFLVLSVILGGFLVVNSVEKISLATNISTTILGLTLTAIATSLPELLTTIFSQKNNQEKITVGNILGSNMYNLSLIGGIVMFSPLRIAIPLADWVWLSLVTLGFVIILWWYRGSRPPKMIAVFLFLLLVLYIFMQNQGNLKKEKMDSQTMLTVSSSNDLEEVVAFTASFEIYTNGTKRIFTDNKYHNKSSDVYITAQDSATIFIKKRNITWSDFFATLPFSLSKECLVTGTQQTFCTTETQKLQFFINDRETPDALDFEIKENDFLRVVYGSR